MAPSSGQVMLKLPSYFFNPTKKAWSKCTVNYFCGSSLVCVWTNSPPWKNEMTLTLKKESPGLWNAPHSRCIEMFLVMKIRLSIFGKTLT